MVKRPTGDIDDQKVRFHVESLQEESMQNPLSLSAAPTADAPLIQANEWGVSGGKLYVRQGNTIYEFTPSSTITVS